MGAGPLSIHVRYTRAWVANVFTFLLNLIVFSFKDHFDANIKGYPTFGSFLAFALSVKQGDKRYWDTHWVPINRQCRPCCRPYSYILHTETLEEEIKETLIDVRAKVVFNCLWVVMKIISVTFYGQ